MRKETSSSIPSPSLGRRHSRRPLTMSLPHPSKRSRIGCPSRREKWIRTTPRRRRRRTTRKRNPRKVTKDLATSARSTEDTSGRPAS
jgi:hypothetical protein